MNKKTYLDLVPSIRTSFSRYHDTLLLASLLTLGLMFIAPVLSILTPLPLLFWVVGIGAMYGFTMLAMRRFVIGCYVALLVTMTFAANVPLASREYLQSLPGTLGPSIWLVQLPLIAITLIVGYHYQKGEWAGFTRPEYLFGGFVLWTAVSALGGEPIRRDTALYFTVFAFQGWVVFVIIIHGIRQYYFEFDSVLGTLLIAVVGHALVGLGQIVNHRPFGLSYLGEADRQITGVSFPTISIGPLNAEAGPYISGFTGMSFILASLLLLVVPILLAIAIRNERGHRGLPLLGFAISAVVLRFTASDGARGGLFLALLTFLVLYLIMKADAIIASIRSLPINIHGEANISFLTLPFLETCFVFVVSLFGVFYPSTKAGATSEPNETPPPDSDPGQATDSLNGTGGQPVDTEGVFTSTWVDNLSIPLFDLSHLGVRFQQYGLAFDILPQYPIVGIGGGNFQYVAARVLGRPMPLHNMYLAILIETGVPGFLLYMATIGSVFWLGGRLVLSSGSRLLVIGILSGMVGYLGFGMWDHLMIDRVVSFFTFWALAGTIVGEFYRTKNETPETKS